MNNNNNKSMGKYGGALARKDSSALAKRHSSALVSQVLAETSPAEKVQVSTKMAIAARLDDLLTERGWGKKEFAGKVYKSPSEITKWLSGTHNFTVDILAEIAVVFGLSVAELLALRPPQVVEKLHFVVKGKEAGPGVRYLTPVSTQKGSLSNYRAASNDRALLPLTTRIPK